jgi:hypothetical protein
MNKISMNTSQLADLVKRKGQGADHRLQRTDDTSLFLSEEKYPMELSPLFENLTKPTSLQNAVIKSSAL